MRPTLGAHKTIYLYIYRTPVINPKHHNTVLIKYRHTGNSFILSYKYNSLPIHVKYLSHDVSNIINNTLVRGQI